MLSDLLNTLFVRLLFELLMRKSFCSLTYWHFIKIKLWNNVIVFGKLRYAACRRSVYWIILEH